MWVQGWRPGTCAVRVLFTLDGIGTLFFLGRTGPGLESLHFTDGLISIMKVPLSRLGDAKSQDNGAGTNTHTGAQKHHTTLCSCSASSCLGQVTFLLRLVFAPVFLFHLWLSHVPFATEALRIQRLEVLGKRKKRTSPCDFWMTACDGLCVRAYNPKGAPTSIQFYDFGAL